MRGLDRARDGELRRESGGMWSVVGRGRIGGKRYGWGVPRAGDVSSVCVKGDIGVERCGFGIEVFDEGDVE
jgi:hypothetical protein